jgi:endonuclease-3
VLSAHTPPARRDAAFAALRRVRALTPDAMARVPRAKLEAAVALTGAYQEQRLHALRAGVDVFRRNPRLASALTGPVRTARRALKQLPQLDAAASHRMLLFASGYPVLPVDLRVQRVAARLGYTEALREAAAIPAQVRRRLSRDLPAGAAPYQRAWLYLSHHATVTCTEGDPHCGVCPLLGDCPEGQRRLPARRALVQRSDAAP